MSSNAQRTSSWQMHMPSVCLQSIEKKDDADKLADSKGSAVHHGTSLTERNYIGLSGTSSTDMSMAQTVNLTNLDSCKEKETECRDTELRLGIGPCRKDASRLHTHQQSGLHHHQHHHLYPLSHISQDGSKAGIGNGPTDLYQSFWPWDPGVAPGSFMIPVPKVTMVPAKRPYLEVIGEKNTPSLCTLGTNSTPSEASIPERTSYFGSSSAPPLQMPAASSQGYGGAFCAWTCSNTMPTATRTARLQENRDKTGTNGAMHTEKSCSTRASAPPTLYKPSPTPLVNHSDPVPPSLALNALVAPHFGLSEQRASNTPDVRKEDATRNKAPMVGWPPVRFFRKNTLQSAAGGKESGALSDVQKQEEASNTNEPVAEDQQIKGSSSKDALFVKAKLDGVRICRKVDLNAYSSYDSLKSALQEMFKGFVCNENTKFDLVRASNYVLTHEDKDGDWMLVGDVPWRMFVTTVKSLRIMKAVDAVGLGKGTNQSQRS